VTSADALSEVGSPDFGRPLPWLRPRTIWLLAWLVALILVCPSDALTSRAFSQQIAPADTYSRRLFKVPNHLFRWPVFVVLGAAVALEPRRRRLLPTYVGTVVSCVAAVHGLKFIVGRARPDVELGPLFFDFFGDPRLSFDSFPSAYAAMATLLTALMARYVPWTVWFLAPAAVLASLSRVALARHFLSDVIAGVGIAVLTVYLWSIWKGVEAFPRLSWRAPQPPPHSARRASPAASAPAPRAASARSSS